MKIKSFQITLITSIILIAYSCQNSDANSQWKVGMEKEVKSHDVLTNCKSACLSNEELNVLYRDHNNKVTLSTQGMLPDQIKLVATGCSITKNGDGKYIVKVNNSNSKSALLSVYYVDDNGDELTLLRQQYKIINKDEIPINFNKK